MDRETRKANLKKLQLPKCSGSKQQQRTTRQSRKASTQNLNSVISDYFMSPRKSDNNIENRKEENQTDKPNKPFLSVSPLENAVNTRSKRTKLDDFIFKDPNNMPSNLKKPIIKSINDDDFVTPEKKVKKAPKMATSSNQAKSSKVSKAKKKQTTIKSAFLRNEQMFAEIAAQHCAADQFDGDDVQLALAISKSEAETRGIASPNEAEAVVEDIAKNADVIRDKLKKYGFRTAERTDYNTFAAAFLPKSKRLKTKWANKFTALTLRQPEIQLKKLQNNIEKLLNSRFRTKALTAEEQYIPSYKLQSSLLKQSSVIGNNCILHNLHDGDQPNELFFVKEFFEIKVLPAGYLLKDWSAIQGRDMTPKVKNTRHKESLQKLENIYQELEEYFRTKKFINWSDARESLEEQRESIEATDKETQQKMRYHIEVNEQNKQLIKVKENKEKTELDEMIELIEEIQKNNEEIENKVSDTTTIYNNKIKELLASTKLLDNMDVSSCSSKTHATINTTQKIRSNSPDLFAESDVEMEVEDKVELDNKNKQNFVIKDVSFKSQVDNINTKVDNNIESRNNSTETIENELTTYEIFSSDEVKNISSLELNKSTKQESHISNSNIDSEHKVIDLTQDESASPVHNEISFTLNQSKSIVEIDLFAQSPLQEEHNSTDFNSYPELYNSTDSNSYPALSKNMAENTNDMIKFTLNLETNDKQQSISEKDDFSIISTSPDNKNQKNEFKADGNNEIEDEEGGIVLREISFQQTNSTFLNFESSKQLETHTQTEKEVFKDALTGNDTIFRELCDKYLNKTKNTTSELKKQNTDFVKSFSQSYNNFTMDFDISISNNLEQKTSFEKSFTQPIHKIKTTPQKSTNYINFTMGFEMSRDNNISLRRKSTSFTVKTPQKTGLDFNTIFPKSHSFKDDHLNTSIDLTQEPEEDTGDADLVDEDDDCLILSDDEINYSIWQANKTSNFQNSEQSDIENDIISLPDVDQSSDEEINLFRKAKIEPQPVEKSYSAFEISNYKNATTKGRANKNTNFQTSEQSHMEDEIIGLPDNDHSSDKDFSKIENPKKCLEKEDSYSDFEILTSKYKTSKEHSQDLKFDRSEFGILEEYSQTINFTPTKVLTEASFLSSPTEKSEPMKVFGNYHSSSQKFQNLLNLVDGKSPPYVDTLDDFDEFDRLVYASPPKAKNSLANKPQGIEKLLTAEISFTEASVSKHTAKNIDSSTILTSDVEEIKYNNKTFTVRYVNSPKPDFTQLSEAELLKQLYNFGIKLLKRKQAVKILEYIYNQTHPILKDERVENNGSVTQANKRNVGENNGNTFDQPCTSKSFLNSNSLATSDSSGDEFNIPNSIKGGHDLTKAGNFKMNLHDSCGQEILRYSDVLSAELCDEKYILQTNVTKKTPRPLLPFHIAWYNLICSNPKLHETILMYEPIDLQEIYVFLKGLGYRYDPKDLKTFFDRRCIIFRYDLTPASKEVNRHVRKSKRSDKIKR